MQHNLQFQINENERRLKTCFIVVRHTLAFVHSQRITFWVPLISITLTKDIKLYNRLHGSIARTNKLDSSIRPTIDLTSLLHQQETKRLYHTKFIESSPISRFYKGF